MYSPVTNGFPDPSPFVGYVIPHGPTSGGTYTTTLSFQANPSVTIRVDEQSDSGTWGNDVVEVPYTTTPCYDATCTITSVVGDGPGGIVQASHQFTVNATINNIGYETLPTTLSNDPLSLNGGDENGNGSYWNFEHDVGYPISAGSASPNIAITLTAPTTLTAETLILHPAYSGLFSFGSGSDCQPPWPSPGCISTPQCPCGEASTDCHSPIIPYSSFQLTPSATASPGPLATDENPTSVNYNAWVSNNAGQNLGSDSLLSSISQFYVLPAGGTQSNPSSSSPNPNTINSYQNGTNYTLSPYNATGGTYSPNIATVRAGDQYCSYIYFPNNLNAGYVGPGGVVAMEYNVAANDSALSCVNVNNKPYTQFFGSDVSAAGGFGTTNCNDTTNGNIYTYLDTSSTPGTGKGSSTQFGAEALNIIEGLGSASLNGTPSVYDGLTFANTGPGTPHNSGNSPQGDYGGNYALQNNCVTDYYNSTLPTKLTTGNSFSSMKPGPALNNGENALDAIRTSTTANSNTINDITLYYQPPAGGSLTINGNSNFPADTNETIYVNGNVYISGDICYSACAANPSWTNVADIPSLFIIAKGNILIAPGVSQLDGAYIAEPTDSAGKVNGIINTCAQNTTSAYPISGIFTNCNNQLTVNGAFVARQIFLDRSYSSLRFGQSGENPLSTTTRSCGAPGSDIPLGAPNEPDCAAEIFNFSPELYLSQPASLSSSGPGSETFDYYTSLPPVL
jgi:hypothetical protein